MKRDLGLRPRNRPREISRPCFAALILPGSRRPRRAQVNWASCYRALSALRVLPRHNSPSLPRSRVSLSVRLEWPPRTSVTSAAGSAGSLSAAYSPDGLAAVWLAATAKGVP